MIVFSSLYSLSPYPQPYVLSQNTETQYNNKTPQKKKTIQNTNKSKTYKNITHKYTQNMFFFISNHVNFMDHNYWLAYFHNPSIQRNNDMLNGNDHFNFAWEKISWGILGQFDIYSYFFLFVVVVAVWTW